MYQLFPHIHVSGICLVDLGFFKVNENESFTRRYEGKEEGDGYFTIKHFHCSKTEQKLTLLSSGIILLYQMLKKNATILY